MIHHGDCLEIMPTLPAESVDSIVTDPPYGLSFMDKNWDHGIPGEQFWREALRVAKPGTHLLAFGGTRTFHRLTCAIEDASWEIRDCIMWVYGSGFPKSLNVATAIAKRAEPKAEPKAEEIEFCQWLRDNSTLEVVSQTLGRRFWDCEVQIINAATKDRPVMARRALVPTAAKWQSFKAQHCGDIPPRIDELAKAEPQRAETPGEEWTPGKGFGTAGEGDWQGWGTALKPAWEPIIVARKPLAGTVAQNVQQYGTGAINVDGCRVENYGDKLRGGSVGSSADGWDRPWKQNPETRAAFKAKLNANAEHAERLGRWPANLIHDGSSEVTDLMGKAARFFYCAKASKADRDDRNHHPTVKPTDLMRYLCRLVTQPDGIVFDPFCGSGSTGKAATLEGFRFIGIERESEYVEIANSRIAHARGNMPLLESFA